ncbi:MAG: hypothetical protein AB2693_24885 [Candidatus Thiodiazotropha sp.]
MLQDCAEHYIQSKSSLLSTVNIFCNTHQLVEVNFVGERVVEDRAHWAYLMRFQNERSVGVVHLPQSVVSIPGCRLTRSPRSSL